MDHKALLLIALQCKIRDLLKDNKHGFVPEGQKIELIMNKKALKDLLKDIEKQGLLGVSRSNEDTIETVRYALDKGLLTRTVTGNFILTEKGVAFLELGASMEIPTETNNFPPRYFEDNDDNRAKGISLILGQEKKLKRNISIAIIFLLIVLIVALIGVYKFG